MAYICSGCGSVIAMPPCVFCQHDEQAKSERAPQRAPSQRALNAFAANCRAMEAQQEAALNDYAQQLSQMQWGSQVGGGESIQAYYGVDRSEQQGLYATQWIPQVPAGDAASTPSEVPQPSPPAASPRRPSPPCVCGQELPSRVFWVKQARVCGDCKSASDRKRCDEPLDERIAAARPDDTDPTSGWTAGATPSAEWP